MKSVVCGVVGGTWILLFASPASADATVTQVVVVAEGPDARAARDEIRSAVSGRYQVVDSSPFAGALARAGQKGAIGPTLALPKKRAATVDRLQRAAEDVQADDVIVVVTTRTASGRKLATAYVVDAKLDEPHEVRAAVGATGHPLGVAVAQELDHLHPAPTPPVAAALPSPAPPFSPVAVSAGPVAPESAPPPIESSADQFSSPLPHRVKHTVGREWVQVDAGIEGGMRRFSYYDGFSKNLRPYTLNAAPLASVDGSLYPFASSGAFLLDDVGLALGYAQAFALQSTSDDGGKLDTEWQRFYAGGRIRARLGSSPRAVVLDVLGAYAGESFFFEGTASPTAAYPSVEYRYVRTLAEGRIPIGSRFAVTADAGYLFVLSAGDVAARFPHSSVGGIEAGLGGAVTIVSGFEARLGLSYRRFFYSMNPVPGDSYVAGGALDQFWSLSGSLAYVY
jgi:hypothetical protein